MIKYQIVFHFLGRGSESFIRYARGYYAAMEKAVNISVFHESDLKGITIEQVDET